jgi:hypothetical protein
MQLNINGRPWSCFPSRKFQNTLEMSPLTAALINELAPMFCFISEQESEAARNLARYVMGYVMTTIGPLQGTPSFRDFADWTQSKKWLKSQCLSCSSKDWAHNCWTPDIPRWLRAFALVLEYYSGGRLSSQEYRTGNHNGTSTANWVEFTFEPQEVNELSAELPYYLLKAARVH